MGIGVEKLPAVTLKVADMAAAVRFYRDVLGMELLYGGPNSVFSSLRMPVAEYPIVNLEASHNKLGPNHLPCCGRGFLLERSESERFRC